MLTNVLQLIKNSAVFKGNLSRVVLVYFCARCLSLDIKHSAYPTKKFWFDILHCESSGVLCSKLFSPRETVMFLPIPTRLELHSAGLM